MSSQIKEADAKKNGIALPSAAKHTVKAGPTLITFAEGGLENPLAAGSAAIVAAAIGKVAPSPAKKRPVTAAPSKGSSSLSIKPKGVPAVGADTCQLDGDLS